LIISIHGIKFYSSKAAIPIHTIKETLAKAKLTAEIAHNRFDESCQGTVPQAIIAFLESEDYTSAIQNAISLGGDSDTIACITGGIAETYYRDVPNALIEFAKQKLTQEMVEVVERFYGQFLTESSCSNSPLKKHSV